MSKEKRTWHVKGDVFRHYQVPDLSKKEVLRVRDGEEKIPESRKVLLTLVEGAIEAVESQDYQKAKVVELLKKSFKSS